MASHQGRSRQMAVEVPARKRRAAQRVASVTRVRRTPAAEEGLPGWEALTKAKPPKASRTVGTDESSLTTARYAMWLTGMALAVTLYVGHVHATQQLFESLHGLKKENLHLHLRLDQLHGELDRTAGPAVLHPKARRLGLQEGPLLGPPIQVRP